MLNRLDRLDLALLRRARLFETAMRQWVVQSIDLGAVHVFGEEGGMDHTIGKTGRMGRLQWYPGTMGS